MRRLLNWVFALAFIVSFMIAGAGEAFAAGDLSDIQAAADEETMEEAMRDVDDLSDEVELLDALTDDVKAAVLGSVFRRRNTVEDISAFEELFAAQYERKATFMNWEEGYPYTSGVSANGTNLVVKTDVDGWVYILSIPDDVQGGVSDEYSFMQLYDADNGIYKKKVWVQGGVETTITVSSSSTGSGNSYRVYYCLRTGGNESGFGEATYTSVCSAINYNYAWAFADTGLYGTIQAYNLTYTGYSDSDLTYTIELVNSASTIISTNSGSYSFTSPGSTAIVNNMAFNTAVASHYIAYLTTTFADGTSFTDIVSTE